MQCCGVPMQEQSLTVAIIAVFNSFVQNLVFSKTIKSRLLECIKSINSCSLDQPFLFTPHYQFYNYTDKLH